jgi:hypothetical protein
LVSGRCCALGHLVAGTRSATRPPAINPATFGGHPVILVDVEEVKVVVAHSERATLRVGDVFLKVDADQARIDVEVEAMALKRLSRSSARNWG